MIDGILFLFSMLFALIVALCLLEVLMRGVDSLLKRRWPRARDRRILEQIGRQNVSMFHKKQGLGS